MKAAIVGAGLGGLTASLALNDVGVETTVYERARSLDDIQVGIGMVLWPNGVNALREVGLAAEVIAAGSELERVDIVAAAGEQLNTWSIGDIGRRAGAPALTLSRGELHKVLGNEHERRLRAPELDCALVSFEDRGGEVALHFAGGREDRADVLIGADGIASPTRKSLTGKGPPEYPPYAGYTIWHSIIPFDGSVPRGLFVLLLGRSSRFAYYRLDDDRVYWSGIAFVPAGGEATVEKGEALDHFHAYTAPVPALIEATAEADIQRHDIYGGEVLEHWGAGRVTLLGDAAHPMTTNLGQGASMAIEDAIVLARCLRDRSNAEASLRAYEELRQARTGRMMKLANRLNSDASLESAFRCWLRDNMLKRLFHVALGRKYEAFIVDGF